MSKLSASLLLPVLRPPPPQAGGLHNACLARHLRMSYRTPLHLRPSYYRSLATSSHPPPNRGTTRTILRLASALALLTTGYGLAIAFPPIQVLPRLFLFRPPPSRKTPARAPSDTPSAPMPRLPAVLTPESSEAYTQALEASLQSLPAVIELRKTLPRVGRPYISIPHEKRQGSFLGTTLRRPGCIGVAPLVFSDVENTVCVSVIHLGPAICGHESVIHGGLIASLMDESLARPAILNLPSSVGVTATLDIQYLKPTMADQFVVLRTELVKKEGRKAWVKGVMSDLEGRELAKAKALFVEPKNAWVLGKHAKERVNKIFGEEEWTGAPRTPVAAAAAAA